MKLKLIVASMGMLGLICCPVFAATNNASTSTDNTTAASTKAATTDTTDASTTDTTASANTNGSRHTASKHHANHTARSTAHLDPSAAPVPVSYRNNSPAIQVCSTSLQSIIIDTQTQSIGRAMPNPCNPVRYNWYNRIKVNGGINIDMGKWGNRNANLQGENYERFSPNDIYLNIGGLINEWATVFASLSYSNTSGGSSWGSMNNWNYTYSDVYKDNKLALEQGYFTLGNFNYSPFYLQVGKQFQDYGRYEIHPITRGMDQVMTEALATSAKLGMILNSGIHASLYGFHNGDSKSDNSVVYGLTIGYDHPDDRLGYGVGIGFLSNMMGVDDIAQAVKFFNNDGVHHSVGSVAAYGDFNTGPLTLNARLTGAAKRFNSMDLPKNGWADLNSSLEVNPDATGAKPCAFSLRGGYTFVPWFRENTVYLGYQSSHEAAGIGLPENRWMAAWNVHVLKNTDAGIEWDHDTDYSSSKGGSGKTYNLATVRLGVRF